jgi:hypothetical protein
MAILPHTFEVPGGESVTIYGETANINYFLANDLEPDTVDGPTTATVSVGGSSRRQYPGDATTINVSGASRQFLKDPSRSSGPALPGKSFILSEIGAEGGGEKRQFTYTGRLVDLHTFLRAEAGKPFYLYNNTGARYTIDAVVTP